jgi:hypothetical protein
MNRRLRRQGRVRVLRRGGATSRQQNIGSTMIDQISILFSAAGSDDKFVCVYELRAGAGARAFGSSDQPAVENWKHLAVRQ